MDFSLFSSGNVKKSQPYLNFIFSAIICTPENIQHLIPGLFVVYIDVQMVNMMCFFSYLLHYIQILDHLLKKKRKYDLAIVWKLMI